MKKFLYKMYLFILVIGSLFLFTQCEFKAPEKWEMPTWHVPLTIPLVNESYDLSAFADSEFIFIDTTNLLYVEFSDSLLDENGDRLGINAEYSSYFTIEGIDVDEISGFSIPSIIFPAEGEELSSSSSIIISLICKTPAK